MSESEAFAVGDRVELRYARAREGPRQGRVVGVYEKFFNVHFGNYQESFLWVDIRIGELHATVVRRAACQMAV